jgi:MFS family permease
MQPFFTTVSPRSNSCNCRFGHLGDTKGRGTCLLWTVLLMGIPTVLIGCLPNYSQIGIAAPILLAILRLVQGLAMGGEFGE